MSTKVFGVRIYLDDHAAPVTADAAIGLYAVTSNLASNAASGQADVIVADGTIFTAGEIVTVTDTADSEDAIILSIATNSLTMTANLTNAYTTARSAKVNANSRFRWVQNTISTVTTWKEGIIVAGGIRPYSREIDLSHGGNIASPGKSEVVVKNTNQFFDTIFDKGIYLNGLKCEIVLFTDATLAVQWTGTCENPTWDTREYSIPLSGYYSRRVANIGTIITEAGYPDASGDAVGKNIPVTLGKFQPSIDSLGRILRSTFAKFVRSSNKTTIFTNDMIQSSSGEACFSPTGLNTFPIVGYVAPETSATAALSYKILVGNTLLHTVASLPTLVGQYLKVVEGKSAGQYRRIASYVFATATTIRVTVDDYFTETLQGNADANIADQGWVQVVDVDRIYTSDSWPCKAYTDSDGNDLTAGLEIYAYADEKRVETNAAVTSSVAAVNATVIEGGYSFRRLPQYAYSDSGSGTKNSVGIVVRAAKSDIDMMTSYLMIPMSGCGLYTQPTLSRYGHDIPAYVQAMGVYIANPALAFDGTIWDSPWEMSINTTNINDKLAATFNHYKLYAKPHGGTTTWYIAFEFILPKIYGVSFNQAYIGISAKLFYDDLSLNVNASLDNSFRLHLRRFAGDSTNICPAGLEFKQDNYTEHTILDIPDFYFADNPVVADTHSIGIYWNNPYDHSSHYHNLYGLEKFVIPATDCDVLNSYTHGAMLFKRETSTIDSLSDQFDIYEMSVILAKELNVKEAIYMPHIGRIYNDTWGGGRGFTAADAIVNPHRILEHVCRLQNWSENSITPTGGWGKGYAANALIKTGVADGSFDDATDGDYAFIKGMECAAQLLTNDECYTDTIKRTICRDFFLANWTGADGYEKVKRIKRSTTATADALTLASIVDRQSIRIQEPTPNDIYPEPFVRYNKNPATGEYESAMRITNVSGTYAAASVEGLSGTDASTYWTRCNTLWKRCRHLNKPPTDLTDLTWANGAQADDIAKEYLTCWIDWMYNASITLKVPFAIAGAWEECHRFTINLPHQTNNVAIECMLTEITVDPNPPYYVTIRALMFSESIPADFNIRKTLTAFGTDDGDWVKTLTAYSNDNDILKVT